MAKKSGFSAFARKTKNTIKTVDNYARNNHIARKVNNTLKEVNSVATPALAAASVFQPELAPVFGGVAAGLKAAEAGSSVARKHFR